MKIDLTTVDETMFNMSPHLIAGETCWLITPKQMGCEWTINNKHFRSSVWNSNGELISASFPKFVNWGEKPEVFPTPHTLHNTAVVEKLDGSLLCISKFKGEFIIRTRGTVDATKLDNGHEIELFKQQHSLLLNHDSSDTWDHSVLLEWLSPANKIVVDYGPVPQFKLIGLIYHDDYSLAQQNTLDFMATMLNIERPKVYPFKEIDGMIADVSLWKGLEGVCVYSNDGQTIHKIKGYQYLKLHYFKSNATFENTVDLFFEFDMPSYQEFQSRLVEHFDWECANMVLGFTSTICDGFKEVNKIVSSMKEFVEPLKAVSRAEAARKILGSFSNTNRGSYCFKLLDGKVLDKDCLKKLLYQVTKK